VIFSDGGDNNSRYSESELISILREADVQVYAVSLFEKAAVTGADAEETGGRALWVKKLDDLPEACRRFDRQIRSEYLIGYSPGAHRTMGSIIGFECLVQPPAGTERLRASWRRGYTAPGE